MSERTRDRDTIKLFDFIVYSYLFLMTVSCSTTTVLWKQGQNDTTCCFLLLCDWFHHCQNILKMPVMYSHYQCSVFSVCVFPCVLNVHWNLLISLFFIWLVWHLLQKNIHTHFLGWPTWVGQAQFTFQCKDM